MLKYGRLSGHAEQIPFIEKGFSRGHSASYADDLTRFFCSVLNSSKSLNGDKMFWAYELVKKVATIHFEFSSLNLSPSGHPAWRTWDVKLKILSPSHAIQELLTASGLSMGQVLTVLSGLALEMLRFALSNWSGSFKMTYLVFGLDTQMMERHFFWGAMYSSFSLQFSQFLVSEL